MSRKTTVRERLVRGSVPALGGGFIVLTQDGASAKSDVAIEEGARIVIVEGRAERVRR